MPVPKRGYANLVQNIAFKEFIAYWKLDGTEREVADIVAEMEK